MLLICFFLCTDAQTGSASQPNRKVGLGARDIWATTSASSLQLGVQPRHGDWPHDIQPAHGGGMGEQ